MLKSKDNVSDEEKYFRWEYGHIRPETVPRADFWRYCNYAALGARNRAIEAEIPYAIDPHTIDRLFVDQGWRCAISGIKFRPPDGERDPFGPSLDRITPSLGYVPGNVRLVCNIVNCALNKWGEAAFFELVAHVVELARPCIEPVPRRGAARTKRREMEESV